MLLRQLEYLDAVAREGHFGRAAASCHVSQPALSTGLQRLEVELGVTLIRRGRRFEGLTPDGEELLRWARAAMASVDGLTAEASRLRGSLAGTLRVGAIPTVAARIGGILSPFLADHPGVRVEFTTATPSVVLGGIADLQLDAGFVYVDVPLPDPVHTVPLYRDRLVLITSDARWTGDDGPVTWAEAAALPLCLLSPGMQKRALIDEAFAAAGVEVRPHVEADSVAALLQLGLAGNSCIIGDTWLDGLPVPGGARVHPLVPEVAPTVGLVTRAGPLAPPVARLLRTSLDSPPRSGPGDR
ncbi:MAG: LysR family transcriptional regulator [Solirubrobacteraceae bacterium]|nr:LysR family transcriptional regulator [Patulibacter sp.]